MPTKSQTRIAYHQLGQTLRSLEGDLRWGLDGSVRIPQAWHDIVKEPDTPPKAQITLKLDNDVLRFFKSMGRGYYGRINAVLRAFMLARLAEVIQAAPEYHLLPEEEEAQIKAELYALVDARFKAKEAAEAQVAALAQTEQRMKVLHEAHTIYRQGK